MAKKAEKTGAIKAGKKIKKIFCPLLKDNCRGSACMWFHKSKNKKYNRCATLEIAQGVQSLGFRISEFSSSQEDEEFSDVD